MAKTDAERKQAQRERNKHLRMQRMELNLAWRERELIASNAEVRGFTDQTEYLVRLVLDDADRIERDRSRNEENKPKQPGA
ncbi:hypothetical protein [Marinobacter adhaerens]|uniref:hypothetical protein n=1 Tax=Marinobacter adhaerens TaxID=1033846 RepID=UPI003BA86BA5